MAFFSEISTQKRDSASEADGEILFKGAAFIAAGVLAASFVTMELASVLKIVLLAVGVLLCVIGVTWLAKYRKAVKAFEEFVPEWDKGRGMYDRFAKELNLWYERGITPQNCDGDTAYFLRLQKERLDKKGLKLQEKVVPSKGSSYGTGKLSRKSLWYTTDMLYENVSRTLSFADENGPVYERNTDMVMYEIVAHSPNEAQTQLIRVTCPNCGAVNSVSKLGEGCPYCGTVFKVKDLFPRVINLFFIRSNSIAKNGQIFKQSMTFSMLAVLIISLIANVAAQEMPLPLCLFSSYFAALLVGGFLGFIIADIRLVATLFDRDGMKHLSPFKWSSSKRKIKNTMLRYDKNFSFDKFEGQLVALVRMAVLAEKPEDLACYRANAREPLFSDILEMTYTNGVCLNGIRQEGEVMHLSVRTWWVNYYEEHGKVKKSGDCIDVTFRRNIAKPEAPGFSITSVSCPGCGGSFDAVRQKKCPYCGNEYHMDEESWVIEEMHLIR